MEKLVAEERLGGRFKRNKTFAGIIFFVFLTTASTLIYYFQVVGFKSGHANSQNNMTEEFASTLQRFSIADRSVLQNRQVVEFIRILQKEPCDRSAIRSLADNLRRSAYRREAANAYAGFADTCPAATYAWRSAASIFLDDLSDFQRAVDVSSLAINAEPYFSQPYFTRGIARFRSGDLIGAIDDLSTFVELTPERIKMNNVSFVRLSESYERLGDICNAMFPLYQWISINPVKNDTPQIRQMLKALRDKKDCSASGKKVEDVFWRQSNVMVIKASINGVSGNFLLDTGASFLTLKKSFASRANISMVPHSRMTVNTANGISTATRGSAAKVELVKIAAANVPVLVQEDAVGTYGQNIDGLLGISFLANFDVRFEGNAVKISTRGL